MTKKNLAIILLLLSLVVGVAYATYIIYSNVVTIQESQTPILSLSYRITGKGNCGVQFSLFAYLMQGGQPIQNAIIQFYNVTGPTQHDNVGIVVSDVNGMATVNLSGQTGIGQRFQAEYRYG